MVLQPFRIEEIRERLAERTPGTREASVEAALRSESGGAVVRETKAPPDAARPAPGRRQASGTSRPALVPRIERLPPLDGPAPATPSIHVTIGRVEVRAVSTADAPEPPRLRPTVTSLDEYLARHAGGGR
jgi:hypothetical protein